MQLSVKRFLDQLLPRALNRRRIRSASAASEGEKEQTAALMRQALRDDAFNIAFEAVMVEIQDEMLTTSNAPQREALYQQAKAAERVVLKMAEYSRWAELEAARKLLQEQP